MTIRSFLTALVLIGLSVMPTKAVDVNVTVSMPNNITATAGQTVTIPINISNIQSGFSLDSFQFVVMYDNTFFDVPSASTFQLGSLTTGLSYSGSDNVDSGNSSLTILRSNFSNPANLTTSSSGSLMTFNMTVKSSATAGSSGYLKFLASQGAANTEILTLSGDNILFNPTITNAANEGLVSIAAVPEPSTYAMAVIGVITAGLTAKRRNRRKV